MADKRWLSSTQMRHVFGGLYSDPEYDPEPLLTLPRVRRRTGNNNVHMLYISVSQPLFAAPLLSKYCRYLAAPLDGEIGTKNKEF